VNLPNRNGRKKDLIPRVVEFATDDARDLVRFACYPEPNVGIE
jgi:hypothetical protein